MFVTVTDLMDYLRDTYDKSSDTRFSQRLNQVKNVPLLVLDDLGADSSSSFVRERLVQILDYRYVTRKPTVMTTLKSPETLDERIRTRILDDRRCLAVELIGRPYSLRRLRR
jgi:DNA replication protein DnaC